MPLDCDCYGGCWAAHSESWPRISAEAMAHYTLAQKVLPHGTYVFMADHLRVETAELVEELKRCKQSVTYDYRYGCKFCHLIWKQRAYDVAVVEFDDGTIGSVPWSALEVVRA